MDDFAEAMLEVQDAKGIAPVPAQMARTFLGATLWWKRGLSLQTVNPGPTVWALAASRWHSLCEGWSSGTLRATQ